MFCCRAGQQTALVIQPTSRCGETIFAPDSGSLGTAQEQAHQFAIDMAACLGFER